MSIGGHHQVQGAKWSDDWQTPPEIIRALGVFDLDPCASEHQLHRTATRMLVRSIDGDGLAADWSQAWLNKFGIICTCLCHQRNVVDVENQSFSPQTIFTEAEDPKRDSVPSVKFAHNKMLPAFSAENVLLVESGKTLSQQKDKHGVTTVVDQKPLSFSVQGSQAEEDIQGVCFVTDDITEINNVEGVLIPSSDLRSSPKRKDISLLKTARNGNVRLLKSTTTKEGNDGYSQDGTGLSNCGRNVRDTGIINVPIVGRKINSIKTISSPSVIPPASERSHQICCQRVTPATLEKGRFQDQNGLKTSLSYTKQSGVISANSQCEECREVACSNRVWLNCPYGRNTASWLSKLADHGNGTALIFARTDTQWFQDHVFARADAILFLAGRQHFIRPDGTAAKHNSGGPSCLVAYGRSDGDRLWESKLPGRLVWLR